MTEDQIKLLFYLDEHCCSNRAIDGIPASTLMEKLNVSDRQLLRAVSDLKDRGLVVEDHGSDGDLVGFVAIAASGRDIVTEIRNTPEREARNRRQRLRYFAWEITKIVLSAFLAVAFMAIFRTVGCIK